jgi:ABC-type transport system involved in multi-copper enzyme maturation permease subunit
MIFLPIVSRELLLASRRRGTYWIRSISGLVVMLVGAWVFVMFRYEPPRDLAMVLFYVLSSGAALLALSSGPRCTSDCISEEKREGTLGLLFLTDLRGYEVILGKLCAGSFHSFYTVMVMLPMLAIPLLMGGGITLNEVARMALVIIDALFFSLTVGICVSSMSRSALKASSMSACLILFFFAGLPLCGMLLAAARKLWPVNSLFLVSSTGYSYFLAFEAPYKTYRSWFWISLAVVHGLSWVCLILATMIARRTWQDRPQGRTFFQWRERWQSWTYGQLSGRAGFRARLLQINPIFWLLARIRSKPLSVWLVLALTGLAWFCGWWRFRRDWLTEGVYIATAIILNLMLRCWFAAETGWTLSESRKSGALELLLSTPVRVQDILQGQWLALRRQFLAPVLLVILIELLFLAAIVREAIPEEERMFWYALWLSGVILFVADLIALYWLGMWRGLTARNGLRAVGGSLSIVLGLPWVGYGMILLFLVLSEFRQNSSQSNPTWKFFLGLWFALGVGVDFFFAAWSRQKLLTEFRIAAQRQYGARTDWLKSCLRRLKPRLSGLAGNWDPEVRA